MLKPNPIDQWPFYYGFVIIVVAIFGLVMSAPGQTIGVSAFTDYFIKSFDLTRDQLSLAYLFGTIMSSLIIAKVGRLIDSHGSRLIAGLSALFLGLTLLLISLIGHHGFWINFLSLCLCFFMLRFFGQGVLTLATRTMVAKWFVATRGRVAGIVGLFFVVIMSLTPVICNHLIHAYTWRGAYHIMAVFIGVFCPIIIFLFYRNTPEKHGLLPDGPLSKFSKSQAIDDENIFSVNQAKRTYTFWVFNIGLALFAFSITAITFNITSLFIHNGLTRHAAMAIFFPTAVLSIFVKLISGWMCDMPRFKNKLKYQLMILQAGLILACLGGLLLQTGYGEEIMILGLGLGTGLSVTLPAVVFPHYFGRQNVGGIMGLNMAFIVFGSAIAPYLYALSLHFTHSYHASLLGNIVICLVLGGLAMRADRPKILSSRQLS